LIYLLYGEDEFSLREMLTSMKQSVEPPELRDVNTTVVKAADVSYDELAAACITVPFLAEKRLVVVEGLLSTFERRARSRSGARAASSEPPAQGRWEQLPDILEQMPPTTHLVLVDGALRESNSMLRKLSDLAEVEVREFPVPKGNALREWIHKRAERHGVTIEGNAAAALAETIGNNLRVIDMELQKLSLYRYGESVRKQDVEEMVAYAKEGNIFAAVDAVLEGRPGVALTSTHQLLDSGNPPSYVMVMIARQVRLLLLAKDLRAQRVPKAEMGRRLSLSGYPLQKTLEQEGKFTTEHLTHIHRKLLEADLSIKTGEASEQLVVEMLVAELASEPRARR
jgi:DNA polymerase-3 subunit delta